MLRPVALVVAQGYALGQHGQLDLKVGSVGGKLDSGESQAASLGGNWGERPEAGPSVGSGNSAVRRTPLDGHFWLVPRNATTDAG